MLDKIALRPARRITILAFVSFLLYCLVDAALMTVVTPTSDWLGSLFSPGASHALSRGAAAVAMALLGGCDDNHVSRNEIYNSNAQGAGAAANEGINTTGGSHNMVCGNSFSCLLPVPANGD